MVMVGNVTIFTDWVLGKLLPFAGLNHICFFMPNNFLTGCFPINITVLFDTNERSIFDIIVDYVKYINVCPPIIPRSVSILSEAKMFDGSHGKKCISLFLSL